jgi:hypothetical protein
MGGGDATPRVGLVEPPDATLTPLLVEDDDDDPDDDIF